MERARALLMRETHDMIKITYCILLRYGCSLLTSEELQATHCHQGFPLLMSTSSIDTEAL